MDNDECIICMDELNYSLPKKRCELCDFKCCIKCFDMLTSVNCPICKQQYFNIQVLYRTISYLETKYKELNDLTTMLSDRLHVRDIAILHINDSNTVYRLKLKLLSYIFGFFSTASVICIVYIGVQC